MTALCVPVVIDDLQTGIILNCRIYSSPRSDDLYFICENATITNDMKRRLKRIVYPDDRVFIPQKYLETLTAAQYRGPIAMPPPLLKETWSPQEQVEKKQPGGLPGMSIPATAKKATKTLEETALQYRTSKYKASAMLDELAANNFKVDEKQTEDIAQMVQQQLEESDVSFVMHNINSMRNVDEYLYTHSLNVAMLNGLMANWLKFDKEKRDELVKVGLLHDIGKLKISPDILNKPGKLTPQEFEEIKKHPFYSFEMLLNSGQKNEAILKGIVQHHEKLNGSGYPCGLNVNQISEYSKITAISDIYDAMVARRVYKDAHSPFEILDSFAKGVYSELDMGYAKLFIDCMIQELKEKNVLLSDGSSAKVKYITKDLLLYPIVASGDRVIETSPDIHIVSLINEEVSLDSIISNK
ncbi:MAG: HD-GYP domain-containing protein [Oscillospiraceae bacterium]|nr:HD-GYP domain-containing protein [Oscillospiraceae bacterium]